MVECRFTTPCSKLLASLYFWIFLITSVFFNNGNSFERTTIRRDAESRSRILAGYRAKTYDFALGIYNKWSFGSVAETVFEKKRAKVEPILQKIFPDTSLTLNSIEQNLRSSNPEDWKNAVVSCRTLLMDLANILAPVQDPSEKDKYINRLKTYVSPKIDSKTKLELLKSYFEELKKRIDYTAKMTQGAAHQSRPSQSDAEDVVLYTYLVISELMQIYSQRQSQEPETSADTSRQEPEEQTHKDKSKSDETPSAK